MRIISGKHKGYRFTPPRRTPARPTTDIAKEGLFNILQNNFDLADLAYLDLFGGTGSISYEMASRGCSDITLVELDRKNCEFIERTAGELNLPITVLRQDVFRFLKQNTRRYDLIFAGPPYPLKTLPTIPDRVFETQTLNEGGYLIMEHNPNHNFENHPNFTEARSYGTTIFAFFKQHEAGKGDP